MVNDSLLNPTFILMIFLLIAGIFGIIVFIWITYRQRKRTFEISIINKEELLKKLNPHLTKIGWHIESDRGNFVTYKKYLARIEITIDNKKAIITGTGLIVEKTLKKANLM